VRPILIATILAGFIVGGGISTANAGVYSYDSYDFSGGNVHFTDASLGIANEYAGAGLITLNGSSVIRAYCVDIAHWLLPSGTYNVGIDPATNPNLTGSMIAAIGALIYNGDNFGAVQLAIWKIEYGAAASFTPDDTGLLTLADTYLENVKNTWSVPPNLALFELTPVDGQVNQTLVYLADPPASVPEPGTLTLLGGGLLMTGLVARRRRSAEAFLVA